MTKEYNVAKTPFSWDKLDSMLLFKANLTMCSEILETPASTIQNHIRLRYDMTFTEYAEKKLTKMKIKLTQKALDMATHGNVVMMIFCLKNLCGWADRIDQQIDTNVKIDGYGLAFDLSKKPEEI